MNKRYYEATFEIFPWNKNFEIGIEEIDIQHKKLVHMVNQLVLHLANPASFSNINKVFDELVQYADYHVKTEESIWREYFVDDPLFIEHEKTHHDLVDQLLILKDKQEHQAPDDFIVEIISFLSKWLVNHILETDKRMAKVVLALLKGGVSISEAKLIAQEEMNSETEIEINTVLSMYENMSSRNLTLMREKNLRLKAEEALLRSEERWQFILEGGVDNVWDWDIQHNKITHSEEEGVLTHVVDNELKIRDYSNIYPLDRENFLEKLTAHLRGETEFYSCKYRIMHENGSWSWHLSRGKVVSRDEEGNPLRMIGVHVDITERELAHQIFENSSQGIMVTDFNNRIISVNKAFSTITGYSPSEVIGENPKCLSSGKHDDAFFDNMWKDIKVRGKWSGEIINKKKNNDYYTEKLVINTIKDGDGKIDHFFAIFDDITDKKKAEQLVFRQANYDTLTQIANRHLFHKSLEKTIRLNKHAKKSFGLLLIDLDYFKKINDSFGYGIGDNILIEVAERIQKNLKENDLVARIGGDEFTVIFNDASKALKIEMMVQQILNDLQKPFYFDNHQLQVSASIGISIYPNDADNAVDLLKSADQAMSKVKEGGRNGFRYFTAGMQEEARKRYILINDLHQALERRQFELYYQPIVNFKTGEIHKAEALLRWNHPVYGSLLPEDFISYAEESGLIFEIDNWVCKEALYKAKFWLEKYGKKIQISVNKSPIQVRVRECADEVLQYLQEIDIDGDQLMIEITERLLMQYDERIVDKLSQLHQAGIKFSLDDFGTGYSSISYLQKFEIDNIKIDKSFVANLENSNQDIALCEAMVTMAHKLGINVTAEGIETKKQKEILSLMGCDFAQGYYFSRPVSVEVFTEMLENKTQFKI